MEVCPTYWPICELPPTPRSKAATLKRAFQRDERAGTSCCSSTTNSRHLLASCRLAASTVFKWTPTPLDIDGPAPNLTDWRICLTFRGGFWCSIWVFLWPTTSKNGDWEMVFGEIVADLCRLFNVVWIGLFMLLLLVAVWIIRDWRTMLHIIVFEMEQLNEKWMLNMMLKRNYLN